MKTLVIIRSSILAGVVFLLSCGDRDPIKIFRDFNLTVSSDKLMITLSWDGVSDDDLTGYNLYRSVGGGELGLYKALGAIETSYVDSSVTSDIVYGYQITALFAGGR